MIDHSPEGLLTGCRDGLGKTRFGGFFIAGQKVAGAARLLSWGLRPGNGLQPLGYQGTFAPLWGSHLSGSYRHQGRRAKSERVCSV